MSMGKHKDVLILQLLTCWQPLYSQCLLGWHLSVFSMENTVRVKIVSDGSGVVVFLSSIKLERMLRIRKDSVNSKLF